MPLPSMRRLAGAGGLSDKAAVDGLLEQLVAARCCAPRPMVAGGRCRSGCTAAGHCRNCWSRLRCSGSRVSQTSHAHAAAAGADLVVLSDALVADPRLVRDLQSEGVPHLPVRVRDGSAWWARW